MNESFIVWCHVCSFASWGWWHGVATSCLLCWGVLCSCGGGWLFCMVVGDGGGQGGHWGQWWWLSRMMVVVEREWHCLLMMPKSSIGKHWCSIWTSSTCKILFCLIPGSIPSGWFLEPFQQNLNSIQNFVGIIWSVWQAPGPKLIPSEFWELPTFLLESVEDNKDLIRMTGHMLPVSGQTIPTHIGKPQHHLQMDLNFSLWTQHWTSLLTNTCSSKSRMATHTIPGTINYQQPLVVGLPYDWQMSCGMPIPDQQRDSVAMDFIGPLPEDDGNK